MSEYRVLQGDCRDVLATLEAESVHAIVTDPPYGLEFMGKEWDRFSGAVGDRDFKGFVLSQQRTRNVKCPECGKWAYDHPGRLCECGGVRRAQMNVYQAWCETWVTECLRVLKPGGHMLAFGGTRTHHRLISGIEDAGFEIRDCLMWVYGSGFPKNLNVSKAIDRAAGAEREVVGTTTHPDGRPRSVVSRDIGIHGGGQARNGVGLPVSAPATDAAQQWDGWGTALKPAYEIIVMARKPFRGTVAQNVLTHGTGALNIDGCRIAHDEPIRPMAAQSGGNKVYGQAGRYEETTELKASGRWPANVVLDEDAAAELDRQSGMLMSGANPTRRGSPKTRNTYGTFEGQEDCIPIRGAESGGASRFFYTAKASTSERGDGNTHPTVKPLALMQWLVRLVTPPGGVVLDPFAGSGTTLVACLSEGFDCIGIEQEAEYIPIIHRRCDGTQQPLPFTEGEEAAS